VLGENFLRGVDGHVADSDMTVAEFGERLATAEDFQGAGNMALARTALENLIDPSTQQYLPTQGRIVTSGAVGS
jgi:hypothetical protein